MDKQLNIAILGTRGIPNRYGGFEACAEELGWRLARKGHSVTVYCTRNHPFKDDQWRGIKRVLLPDPEKSLGTAGQFIYDLLCNLHSQKCNPDIVLHLGYSSDSLFYRQWAKGSIHIVNMDGQEWKRLKYNKAVRYYLRHAEEMATRRSSWLVADSRAIESYLLEKYDLPVRYIAYGAEVPEAFSDDHPGSLGLRSFGYDLVIARMEPENNIEMAVRAKIASDDGIPLVIVSNMNAYKHSLEQKYRNEPLIHFAGPVYEKDRINGLRHFSRLYVHGHSVGGTNPSLLEAMACGCRIVSHANPFNMAVLGEKALYYSSAIELSGYFSAHDPSRFETSIDLNLKKIEEEFNWDVITDAYEKLFIDAITTT